MRNLQPKEGLCKDVEKEVFPMRSCKNLRHGEMNKKSLTKEVFFNNCSAPFGNHILEQYPCRGLIKIKGLGLSRKTSTYYQAMENQAVPYGEGKRVARQSGL